MWVKQRTQIPSKFYCDHHELPPPESRAQAKTMWKTKPLNPFAEPFHISSSWCPLLPPPLSVYHPFGIPMYLTHATSDDIGAKHKKRGCYNYNKRFPAEKNGRRLWCKQTNKFPVRNGWKKMTVAERDQADRQRMAKESKKKQSPEKIINACAIRRPIIPFPPTMVEARRSATTTVMIRNIPNLYQFKDLLQILDDFCWKLNKTTPDPTVWSKFDFLYLPVDYRKHANQGIISNLGYAFVNFTTASAAFKFYQQHQGLEWNDTQNWKKCHITTAHFQGKETLTRIFRRKVFRCENREFLPVVFSDGHDGFNRQIKGTFLGKHIMGLPRNCLPNQEDASEGDKLLSKTNEMSPPASSSCN